MLKHKKIESVIDEMARQLGHELNGQDKLVIRTKTAMVWPLNSGTASGWKRHPISGKAR